MPQPALRPASYPVPFVIGVAASDQALGRSCFSNAGDIAAPGGGLDPNPTAPRDCTPSAFTDGLRTCSGSGRDCPYGVISFSPSVTTTGYALWSGTSFATPQVSGLAALLLQQNVSAQEVFTEMLTTPITDTHLGKGIVDVDQTVP
jgi:subtilisin family serine protease